MYNRIGDTQMLTGFENVHSRASERAFLIERIPKEGFNILKGILMTFKRQIEKNWQSQSALQPTNLSVSPVELILYLNS